jgi:hypothetical protein
VQLQGILNLKVSTKYLIVIRVINNYKKLEKMEDREYKNVSAITLAAGLVY